MYWPQFDNEGLSAIVLSLKKRSKALKHKTIGIKCERVIERGDVEQEEKLELEISDYGSQRKIVFRVYIWADRWVWIDIREPAKKGWLWEWELEGRLLGNDGRGVLRAIEETLAKTFGMETSKTNKFMEIWETLLAQGPKEID